MSIPVLLLYLLEFIYIMFINICSVLLLLFLLSTTFSPLPAQRQCIPLPSTFSSINNIYIVIAIGIATTTAIVATAVDRLIVDVVLLI